MIPRTLVPVNVRPVKDDEAKKPARRLDTYMDVRTVVPSGLSEAPPLDGKTSIPAHLPLGVLVDRTLVPRGMPAKPIESFEPVTEHVPIAVLDSRVVVPAYVEPAAPEEIREFEHAPELTPDLREVIEPDIFITGDANLLIEPEVKRDPKWDLVTRVASLVVHVAVIIFLLSIPKLFPPQTPTQNDIALARKQLQWIALPPGLETPKPTPPAPKVHINRETLNKVAPPAPQPEISAPANPQPDLPDAPRPQQQLSAIPAPVQPAPSHIEPILPAAPPANRLNLQLPQVSPGRQMQEQVNDAISRGVRQGGVYSSPGAVRPGVGGPGMGNGVEILSDRQGVNFDPYITRLLATLKRNWYAVMPTSANMGERGLVSTTFKVYPDGSVRAPEPILERTSGREPLDNAAMSAIHTSNPFEPLPSEFHGPYLELRIWFLYNIRPEEVGLH